MSAQLSDQQALRDAIARGIATFQERGNQELVDDIADEVLAWQRTHEAPLHAEIARLSAAYAEWVEGSQA